MDLLSTQPALTGDHLIDGYLPSSKDLKIKESV